MALLWLCYGVSVDAQFYDKTKRIFGETMTRQTLE